MLWKPIRMVPDDTRINFIGQRKIAFAGSLLALLVAIFLLSTEGLNWGIDFTGGMLIELRAEEAVNLSEMRAAFAGSPLGEVSLQKFGTERDILIRLELAEGGDQAEAVETVKNLLSQAGFANLDYRKVEFVGPAVGEELVQAGIMALGLACLGILFYIWFRFEWQYGVGAVLALLHDGLLTMGFYSFTGYEFGLTSIAAILTILGYSINDSVVIYDRIRENLRKFKKMPLPELLNISINNTLARTLLTGGTTIVALLALVLFGGEVLEGFAAAILFGVVIGTYSSVYIAAPVLIYFGLRREDSSDDAADPSTAKAVS